MLTKLGTMTNATKASIIATVNATFGLLVAFNVALTEGQQGAIITFVNAALGLVIAMTFTNSAKRVPDPPAQG